MTERSSTPLVTICGLSVGALEDWRLKKFKFSAAATYVFIRCSVFFYLSLLHSLCEAIFRHTLRLSSELKRGMPKHSSRGTHSSSDDRAERKVTKHTIKCDTCHEYICACLKSKLGHLFEIFKAKMLKEKNRPTVCLSFAVPVVFFCYKLEGLGAAVGVQAPT